ncbi:hypothetical protein GH5_02224 [Leishmania sp. Ghana 2012 LV757]|uniref:hypothetical protein n=1 Tax=Leishmania sp. Ghana 2012 LV757 TaxID=2803181 RepID=UPI001B71982C|nr:hypothetical protein GH5_02224 [Leishmania sp. Ghana 2012 LV757]
MSTFHTRCSASPSEASPREDQPPLPSSVMVLSLLRSLSAVIGDLRTSPAPSQTALLCREGASWAGGDGLSVYASVLYLRHCCLVILLCRWVAERVAIPAGSELSAVLRRIPSARLVGGPSRPWMTANDEADRDDDGESRCEVHCSAAALADCRVSTLLPAPPPQLARAALEALLEVHGDGVDDDEEAQIDAVLSHICAASSSPDADADVCSDIMRDAFISMRDTWHHVKGRVSLKDAPSVRLTDDQIQALLYTYTEASVEHASSTLLRTIETAPDPTAVAETEMAVAVAALGAVHELLGAQQVARIATSLAVSMPADKFILERVRALLLALLSASPLSSSRAQFYLHSNVELSIDPSRSVAGCGLVAIGTVGEGELLAREAALAMLSDTGVRLFSQGGAEATSSATSVADRIKDSTRIQKESMRRSRKDVASASTTEEAETVSSAPTRQQGDSVPLNSKNGERGAAAQLLDRLIRFPDLLCSGWHRWAAYVMSDAFALQSASRMLQSQVGTTDNSQVGAAAKSSPCSLHLAADAPSWGALGWREGAVPTTPSLALQLLLGVRGVDEFRIDPPPRSCRHRQCDDHHGCMNAGLKKSAGELDVAACPFPSMSGASTKALFPLLRHVNHACVPNTIVVLDRAPVRRNGSSDDGVVASLVALRAIESGEEITVSYVPATTALTVTHTELSETLGFRCRCHTCTRKAAPLHGQVCGECGQLIYASDGQGGPEPPSDTSATAGVSKGATVFRHEEHCLQRRRTRDVHGASDGGSSVAAQLQLQLDDIAAQLAQGTGEDDAVENARDPVVVAVRHLVDLDDCVARTYLPTHHLRLRLRLEAFAYSTVARGLGSTLSAELIHLCAGTLEELEILLPPNHPLLTGLRMYLVFSRGRHVQAVNDATYAARGTRHAECCGAVREQATLMQLPFVVDPLVRRCVVRCFQEHYVQILAWRADWLSRAGEAGALGSFLARYTVELEACGVTTAEHMELLSCLEDGAVEG